MKESGNYAEKLVKKTEEAKEKLMSGGVDSLQAHFELQNIQQEAYGSEELRKEAEEENKERFPEKIAIKKGLDFVFEKNPKLSQIGSIEQYSEYLDTIFPDSKFKDVVYHGTREQIPFEKFHTEKVVTARNFGKGVYFSPTLDKPRGYTYDSGMVLSAVVNVTKPFITESKWKEWFRIGVPVPNGLGVSEYTNGCDTLFNYDYLDRDTFKQINEYMVEYGGEKDELGFPVYQLSIRAHPELKEVVVENPDRIHILGSEADLKGFKEFVESQK